MSATSFSSINDSTSELHMCVSEQKWTLQCSGIILLTANEEKTNKYWYLKFSNKTMVKITTDINLIQKSYYKYISVFTIKKTIT